MTCHCQSAEDHYLSGCSRRQQQEAEQWERVLQIQPAFNQENRNRALYGSHAGSTYRPVRTCNCPDAEWHFSSSGCGYR